MRNKMNSFDQQITEYLRRLSDSRTGKIIFGLLSHSGDSWYWCAVLFVIWIISERETQKVAAFWGLAIAGAAVLVYLIKKVFKRERPAGEWGGIYRKQDPHSFPSGHAVRAGLIICLAWQTFGTPWAYVFILWGLMMMLSRVVMGVHYFSDIVAGILLGLAIGMTLHLIQPFIYQVFPWLFDRSLWFRGG